MTGPGGPRSTITGRRAAGTVLGAGLAALVTVSAAPMLAAEPEEISVENYPDVDQATLDSLIEPIEVPDLTPISVPAIQAFLPEVSSDGASTVVRLDTDVLFDFGEATLSDQAQKAVVDAVADIPDDAAITVVGHTDSRGGDSVNLPLSRDRAEAVAEVIEEERPDLEVKSSGKGSADPVEPNSRGGEDNPEGREKNRRVEIRYQD